MHGSPVIVVLLPWEVVLLTGMHVVLWVHLMVIVLHWCELWGKVNRIRVVMLVMIVILIGATEVEWRMPLMLQVFMVLSVPVQDRSVGNVVKHWAVGAVVVVS